MTTVILDTPLTSHEVAALAAGDKLCLSDAAAARIAYARALVDVIVAQQIPAYGINTGVGALCDTFVDRAQQSTLSRNILVSSDSTNNRHNRQDSETLVGREPSSAQSSGVSTISPGKPHIP